MSECLQTQYLTVLLHLTQVTIKPFEDVYKSASARPGSHAAVRIGRSRMVIMACNPPQGYNPQLQCVNHSLTATVFR